MDEKHYLAKMISTALTRYAQNYTLVPVPVYMRQGQVADQDTSSSTLGDSPPWVRW